MKPILTITFVILLTAGCSHDQSVDSDPVTPEMLAEGFTDPPDSVKPWVYWYWISDNNTREGVTRDLEAMAEAGIGEALIGNIGYEGMPYGKDRILSEEWWQLIEHTIREGKRTGVNIGLFNCPGWSQSGGPWIKPEQAMQKVVWTEVDVEGGKAGIWLGNRTSGITVSGCGDPAVVVQDDTDDPATPAYDGENIIEGL